MRYDSGEVDLEVDEELCAMEDQGDGGRGEANGVRHTTSGSSTAIFLTNVIVRGGGKGVEPGVGTGLLGGANGATVDGEGLFGDGGGTDVGGGTGRLGGVATIWAGGVGTIWAGV